MNWFDSFKEREDVWKSSRDIDDRYSLYVAWNSSRERCILQGDVATNK